MDDGAWIGVGVGLSVAVRVADNNADAVDVERGVGDGVAVAIDVLAGRNVPVGAATDVKVAVGSVGLHPPHHNAHPTSSKSPRIK